MPNHSYEQRKLALIDEITAAFDGVARGDGVSISEARVIDDNGSDSERAAARKRDTETRWQDVPDENIFRGDSHLTFMDEVGFHYYIPAYVVWFLRNMDDEGPQSPAFNSNTFDSLIFALGADRSGALEEFYLSKYQLFTLEQSKAIAHFLHFLQFEEEIEDLPENGAYRALERYWGKFK